MTPWDLPVPPMLRRRRQLRVSVEEAMGLVPEAMRRAYGPTPVEPDDGIYMGSSAAWCTSQRRGVHVIRTVVEIEPADDGVWVSMAARPISTIRATSAWRLASALRVLAFAAGWAALLALMAGHVLFLAAWVALIMILSAAAGRLEKVPCTGIGPLLHTDRWLRFGVTTGPLWSALARIDAMPRVAQGYRQPPKLAA